MSKKLLLTVLISTLLGGCNQKNDLPVEGSQGASTDNTEAVESQNSDLIETEGDFYEEYSSNSPVELKLFKELEENEISEVTVLSENRIIVNHGEKSIIYDEKFDIIKDLGELKLKDSYYNDLPNAIIGDGIFIYQKPYFHEGKMDYKFGLMDFDGNILYDAVENDIFKSSRDEINEILDSLQANTNYTYSKSERVVMVDEGDNSTGHTYGLALVQTYPDHIDIIKELVPAKYEHSFGGGLEFNCVFEACKYQGFSVYRNNGQSIDFKRNDKLGIVDFEGNEVLEAEYGEIKHLEYNEEENQDYYAVINESGKVGIFSSKNGWIIEPTFSYNDEIKMINSNIIVKSYTSKSTHIYDNTGNIIDEFEFIAGISTIKDLSNENENSNEFYNVIRTDVDVNLGLFNNNFEQIPDSTYYESYATISDKAIVACYGSTCDLLTIDGVLVTGLPCKSIYDITVVDEKYLLIGTTIYELVEL